MNNGTKKIRSVKVLTFLSILIVLSGMAAMTSADDWSSIPNEFYGTVKLNGADAPVGTAINAYIDGELRGTIEVITAGEYGYDLNYLLVNGNESEDDGKPITFTVCGVANETAVWYNVLDANVLPRELNLSAEAEEEPPVVTDPSANPESIPADGVSESRLNVTVTDESEIDFVTVNLSAIGGSDVHVMDFNGGDMYSTDTNATVGTPPGTYYLYVNASDMFGNYEDGVCIELEVTAELCGDTNGDGKVDMDELFAAIDAYIADPTDMDELFCVIDAYIATA